VANQPPKKLSGTAMARPRGRCIINLRIPLLSSQSSNGRTPASPAFQAAAK
jgi:hypothetical protein